MVERLPHRRGFMVGAPRERPPRGSVASYECRVHADVLLHMLMTHRIGRFGVGFDAKAMGDAPWTVVVDGAGEVTERRLGNHAPGTLLPRSVRVLSNTVAAGGNRTVVLTRKRSLPGAHFNFSLSETTIPFISAVGSGPHFAIHKSAADSILTMLATDAPNCVCAKDPPPFGT